MGNVVTITLSNVKSQSDSPSHKKQTLKFLMLELIGTSVLTLKPSFDFQKAVRKEE